MFKTTVLYVKIHNVEKFKLLPKAKLNELPKTSGVYAFKSSEGLLYIGKAINIQNRVKNHFYPHTKVSEKTSGVGVNQPSTKDEILWNLTDKIGYFETNSEIEALILEANLIKRYQPKFNVVWKDGKNYFYVAIAKNIRSATGSRDQYKSRFRPLNAE